MGRTSLLNLYKIEDRINVVILNNENNQQDMFAHHQLCMFFWIKKENFFLIKGNKELNLDPILFFKELIKETEEDLKYSIFIIDSQKEIEENIQDSLLSLIKEKTKSEIEVFHYITSEPRSVIDRQPCEVIYKKILFPLIEEKGETGKFDGFILTLNQLALKYESIKDREDSTEKFRMQNLIEKYNTYHKLLTLFNVDITMTQAQHINFEHANFEEIMKIMVSISEPLSTIAEDIF